jgi:hypothetical protein
LKRTIEGIAAAATGLGVIVDPTSSNKKVITVAAVTTETGVIMISMRISRKIAAATHHLNHQNGTGTPERRN